MALSTCKECGAQVSTEAKTCPHCGVMAPTQRASSPQLSALTKRYTMSPTIKVLLAVMLVGLVANVMISSRRATQSRDANQIDAAKPVDACFDRGFNGATIYLSDMKAINNIGYQAEGMRDFVCKDAVQKIGTPDCLGQCEAGFKHKIKSWVKEGH